MDVLNKRTTTNTAVADSLLENAKELKNEIDSQVGISEATDKYNNTLDVYVQQKQEQIERLEDKLELLIDTQTSKLNQLESQKPGIFAKQSTRNDWQRAVDRQRAAIEQARNRLEQVQEIKTENSLHSSRIEELAKDKLAKHEPEIDKEWKNALEQQRLHRLHLLMEAQKKEKQQLSNNRARTLNQEYER